MDNVIEFPWYRSGGNMPFDYIERFAKQKDIFLENFSRLTAQVLSNTSVMPEVLIKVVDEEKPSTTLSSYSGWLLTKKSVTKQKVRAYGSHDPISTFESYSGIALSQNNIIFEYGALDENLEKGQVLHFKGRHLVDEIPDDYIKSSPIVSSELILSLARINTVMPESFGTFKGLSTVK